MKNWLSIICLGTVTFYCQAEQKDLSSSIKAVTVYSDRAAINRFAEITLPAGEHELVFNKLPANLEDSSLQISAVGTAPTTILDVTSRQEYLITPANERIKELEVQIEAIQEKLAQLGDKEQVIRNQLDFIKKAQNTAIGANNKANRPSITQIQEMMQLSSQTLAELMIAQRALVTERQELNKQLQILRNDVHPLQRQNNLQVKNVTVRVSLEQAGKVQLDLNYMTYGAKWWPTYDARLSTKDRKVTLNYLGVVQQQTGEDWKNVKLTLSTAKPSLGGNAPELGEWKISEYNPNIVAGNKNNLSGGFAYKDAGAEKKLYTITTSSSGFGTVSKSAPAYAPAQFQAVTVDMGATSAAFNISEPTSLISGNAQQKVAITTIELPSKLQYQITPRLKETAYLQADTTNNSDYPLISGQLNIFMDGRFITSGTLKATMPGENFKLELGGDEGIAVTYKKVKDYTEKTGIISSGERITYESLITIQNNKASTETIIINDQIPVSQNEKITVKLLSPTKGVTQDKEGKLTWNLSLTPNEKVEIPVTFSVDYPAGTKVIGL